MDGSRLFAPYRLGNLELRNRIAMTGIGTALPGADGSVTDELIAYFGERARGGAGLLITEVVRPCDGHGLTARYQLSAAHDHLVPGMRRLADAVHAHGAKMFFQLHHPGRETFDEILNGEPAISPSGIPCPVNRAKTRAMTAEEIPWLIGKFGAAARRIRDGGIDGVELHAAHGYLFHQFLSPLTNKRTDAYGGSEENRFRFLAEVIGEIRKTCGPAFPVSVRFPLEDFMGEAAIDLPLGIRIAEALERVGVDLLNATVGFYETGISNMLETASHCQGWRNGLLRELRRRVVKTPLLAVNCVRAPAFAEWMLEEGMTDLVGLGRALLADPEWVNKAREGRERDIRPCLSCVYCVESLRHNASDDSERNSCAVNARTFNELRFPPAAANGGGRTVVVVGAGPAGMECALTLARRKFRVILFERDPRIGGQLNIAAKPKDKYRIDALVAYYAAQLAKYGVDVRVAVEAAPDTIRALSPEAVFVCTGSTPVVPATIPGAGLPHVLQVEDILTDRARPRNKRVAVIGSGMTGLETAEYLAARGNVVSVVEMLDEIGKDIYFQNRDDVLESLGRYAVRYYPSHRLLAITETAVRLADMKEQSEITVPADCVVLSLGMRPDQTLLRALERAGGGIPVIPLGDAGGVGRIKDAVHSGFKAAYSFSRAL